MSHFEVNRAQRPLPRALRRAGSSLHDDDLVPGSADALLCDAVSLLAPLAVASHALEVGERVCASLCDEARAVSSGALADAAAAVVVKLRQALLACGAPVTAGDLLPRFADRGSCRRSPTDMMAGVGEALADAMAAGPREPDRRRQSLTAALGAALTLFELAVPDRSSNAGSP